MMRCWYKHVATMLGDAKSERNEVESTRTYARFPIPHFRRVDLTSPSASRLGP